MMRLLLVVLLLCGCSAPHGPIPASGFAISPEWDPESQVAALRAVSVWCEQAGQCVPARIGEPEEWEATLRPGTDEECDGLPLAGRVHYSSRRPPDVWVCPGYDWTAAVMVHEVGHALLPRLEHTDDPRGVMYPDVVYPLVVDLAPSDLDAVSAALEVSDGSP